MKFFLHTNKQVLGKNSRSILGCSTLGCSTSGVLHWGVLHWGVLHLVAPNSVVVNHLIFLNLSLSAWISCIQGVVQSCTPFPI